MHLEEEPPGVVVLYSDSQQMIKGEARDLLAEQGVVACAKSVAAALEALGFVVAVVPLCGDVESGLAPYPPTDWVIFNLGEGLEGRLFEEVRIAWAIEAMGYVFTGADATALASSTHKAKAKTLLEASGVATPPWRVLISPSDVDGQMVGELGFPVIVKPVAEDASIGIGVESVVCTLDDLRARVAYVVRCYRQAALVESFIDGREFNVSVWGDPPEVLPLAEVDLTAFADPAERIVSFSAKWESDSFAYRNTPVVCPADADPELGRRIAACARRAWEVIGCRDYARVDMRIDADGSPYVIEVNCNPDLSADAGFFRAAQAAGYEFGGMVLNILRMSHARCVTHDHRVDGARRFRRSAADGHVRHVQAVRDRVRARAVTGLSATGRG
jgi:D-alanine-D-alanine ligase